MRSVTLIVLLTLAIIAKADVGAQVDSILYQKVVNSTPAIDQAFFDTVCQGTSQLGYRYANESNRHELHNLTNVPHAVSIGGAGQLIYPFADFEALKWGEKIEHLESRKFVSGAGGWSWGVVTASVGIRVDETVYMRSAVGTSMAQTKQMYQSISYQSCKKKWFKKKCHTAWRNEPRGLTHDEVNVINTGLGKFAHLGALTQLPQQVSSPVVSKGLTFNMLGNFAEGTLLFNVQPN